MASPNPTGRSSAPSAPLLNLKPSKQTCAVLGGLMGVTLLASGGLWFLQNGRINELQQQVNQKRADVASGEKIAKRLETVEGEYEATRSKLRYLESSVSANEYVPTLLKQTETLAKSVSLRVDSVRPTLEPAPPPPADKEERKKFKPWPYDKLHVDMQVRGSYWNVARFLYRLTEFPKILSVESIKAAPPANSAQDKNPVLTVNVNLTGFIFKEGEAASVPATRGPKPAAGAAVPKQSASAAGESSPRSGDDARTPGTPRG